MGDKGGAIHKKLAHLWEASEQEPLCPHFVTGSSVMDETVTRGWEFPSPGYGNFLPPRMGIFLPAGIKSHIP